MQLKVHLAVQFCCAYMDTLPIQASKTTQYSCMKNLKYTYTVLIIDIIIYISSTGNYDHVQIIDAILIICMHAYVHT